MRKTRIKNIDDNIFKDGCNTQNPHISILGTYSKMLDSILVKCKVCGYEWTDRSFFLFHKHVNCHICHAKERNSKNFYDNVKKINPHIELLEEYTKRDNKIKIKHKECNHTYEITSLYLLKLHECFECWNLNHPNKHTHDQFKETLRNRCIDITLLSEYTNNATKIKYKCNKCLTEHFASPINIYKTCTKTGCSSCRSRNKIYQGEEKIKEFLIKSNIKFQTQKKFEGCKYKSYLYFDFYIPDVNTCIEYDGYHHFNERYYKKHSLKTIQERDKIKNDYCLTNHIGLWRIPYWEFSNIDELLNLCFDERNS